MMQDRYSDVVSDATHKELEAALGKLPEMERASINVQVERLMGGMTDRGLAVVDGKRPRFGRGNALSLLAALGVWMVKLEKGG